LNLKILLINANLNTNITDCEVNTDPVITFEDLLVCSKNIYKEDSCYCYMDQCLESVRYSHIKSCGFTSLPKDVTTEAPVEEVVASNDTSGGNDTKTEYSEQELLLIYAEMFNHTIYTTTTTTTTTTEDINILIANAGIPAPIEVITGQYGIVISDGRVGLCDCKDLLPEPVRFKVVVKSKFWNPLFQDSRTSLFAELQKSLEQELQLIVAASEIDIKQNRTRQQARHRIELSVLDFTEYQGLTQATVQLNISESHFNNDLLVETEFAIINDQYQSFNGSGVFGRTFKKYSRNIFDSKLQEVFRVLPVSAQTIIATTEEEDEDPMETLR